MFIHSQDPTQDLKRSRACTGLWMLRLMSSMVHVPLQPRHSCHSALPSHSCSHEVSLPLKQPPILIEFCGKFSDTKLKSASIRLLSHLEGYHIKRNECARLIPGSVERKPSPVLPLMWYMTLAEHFCLWSFSLFSTVTLLDFKVSNSFISSDILGFVYSRLNHIKLLCLL